ncbi:MAG TPA: inositol monophosphatase family protein [Candidatus Paceibacterota bacterium]|nr:inositol monophosphatase family protein [Candidatus Paceibacterota bacterium]
MDPYDFACKKAVEAGEMALELRAKGFETDTKGGNARDLVTSVDTEISAFLVSAIHDAFPTHRIYSEEGNDVAEGNAMQWALDPIDGTSNFSRGIPHFAVCIGLLENGKPILGVVYDPNVKELFSFKKGQGAFLNGKPIHVSAISKLADAQVVCSPGARRADLWDWSASTYRKLMEHTLKRGMFGSSSLDLCYIAAGRADVGVYGTLAPLDVASAFGILSEAGGSYCDKEGKEVVFSDTIQRIYMANSESMLKALRELIP